MIGSDDDDFEDPEEREQREIEERRKRRAAMQVPLPALLLPLLPTLQCCCLWFIRPVFDPFLVSSFPCRVNTKHPRIQIPLE